MEFHEGLEEQRNPYPQQAGMVEVKRDREGKQKEVRLGTGERKKENGICDIMGRGKNTNTNKTYRFSFLTWNGFKHQLVCTAGILILKWVQYYCRQKRGECGTPWLF